MGVGRGVRAGADVRAGGKGQKVRGRAVGRAVGTWEGGWEGGWESVLNSHLGTSIGVIDLDAVGGAALPSRRGGVSLAERSVEHPRERHAAEEAEQEAAVDEEVAPLLIDDAPLDVEAGHKKERTQTQDSRDAEKWG